MTNRVAIIGSSAGAAQAALTLAEMGVEVALITSHAALRSDKADGIAVATSSENMLHIWPLLLRAASHPLVTLHTNSEVRAIDGKWGKFTIRTIRHPRYVREDLCTSCGSCEEVCSVQIPLLLDGQRVIHSAIHAPVLGAKIVPSAYSIAKSGVAPCRAACPVGINVQGFVSLLSKGKVDEALSLINEAAPLAGVLGRICTHPCEGDCKRGEVDSPVFIRALHRHAADNAPGGINYSSKSHAISRREKVAIVGSGPSGLSAAWELARRGYRPTIFESHGVVGGMLATGIPRFRLPREVRDKEVKAIEALGVDIKTGVTVGRDVAFADLRERGYRAFFLAIGAHQNNKLNIPGEDLEGVVDGISLLFALNLKVGASVGSNVVVIGGGNSAVDSARTAKRRRKGVVRILCIWEEMTAVREDVEDAIEEGISIEYLTAPVEILGDGTKVTGLRCQRTAMSETSDWPEPIPGSEFVIDADHVVVAIGQRPNTSLLSLRRLEIGGDNGNIEADPLTLETNMPGIFAGGDCVTGPNNVVEAVAAGLRAAESMDRYLRGRDLRRGRSLEKPEAAEVDVKEREASHHKRAHMPVLSHHKRKSGFEETDLGLPGEVAEREASRCLNCALCSECMECERVCELNAVFHKDSTDQLDIGAELLVDFTSTSNGSAQRGPLSLPRPGFYTVETDGDRDLESELARASAVALQIAIDLNLKEGAHATGPSTERDPSIHLWHTRDTIEPTTSEEARIGVVLCECGGSINSVVDFQQVASEVLQLPGVFDVQQTSQACSKEGAWQIAAEAAKWGLDRLVVAACRCCNLEQICFSCTDRRVMCQRYLSSSPNSRHDNGTEFVNIREQCAWVHKDTPAAATRKAIDMISAGIARAREPLPAVPDDRPIEENVLVVGAGLCGLAAARDITTLGYTVDVVTGPQLNGAIEQQIPEYQENRAILLKQLEEQGIAIKPWPQTLELNGSPGDYETVLGYGSQASHIKAGAVILDLGALEGEVPPVVEAISRENLLGRIIAHRSRSDSLAKADSTALRGIAINDTAGIFVVSPKIKEPPEEQVLRGRATAARASVYLSHGTLRPRATAVIIDSKLCRGCGDCATICPYIEIREQEGGMACAYVDQALCLGCGACIAHCPTGAITQPGQSEGGLISTLEALLGRAASAVEAI